MSDGLLTDEERALVYDLGEIWNRLAVVIGLETTRAADVRELIAYVHALQHAVMAQAAARAYPDEFRLLGQTLRVRHPDTNPAEEE